MVNRKRRSRIFNVREIRDRDLLSGRCHHEKPGEDTRILSPRAVESNHAVVLIQHLVLRRDLALREGVIQESVDFPGIETVAGRGFPVHDHLYFRAAGFRVAVHACEFRKFRECLVNRRAPLTQCREIVTLNTVLISRVRAPAAGPEILNRHQKERRTWHPLGECEKPVRDLRGCLGPLIERLQLDKELSGVPRSESAAARGGEDVFDGRILFQHFAQTQNLRIHLRKACLLISPNHTEENAGILIRKKTLVDRNVEENVSDDSEEKDHHREEFVFHHGAETRDIGRVKFPETGRDPVKHHSLGPAAAVRHPMGFRSVFPEKTAAEHRCQCERHKHRNRECDRKRHREFPEELSDNASHEKQRDENRDQGRSHGKNREPDFVAAFQRGLHRCHSFLDMAADVFHHHNCVIHHKACTDNERHHGESVQTVAEEIHRAECTDQ